MCKKHCKINKLSIGLLVLSIAYFYNGQVLQKKVPGLVIETTAGRVRGITSRSRDGHEFYAWLGIPYAEPPLGPHLRFESPVPVTKWDGILETSEYGSVCTQIDMMSGSFLGEESCLFLNVFSPKGASPKNLLPTMVFIHGGLFVFGSADRHGPDYILDEQNVVLVTLNYRLNSLGFLNTNDGVVRGNMGLKDQSFALKWVQENIRKFGGDPDRVTIFGESAGSVSVHLHTLSKMSKGLFSKAISQSGTGLAPWGLYREDPAVQAKRFGKMVGCPTESSRLMIDCMKKLPVVQIVQAHYEVMDPNRDAITLFVPTIERVVNDTDTFLPDEPYNILKRGEAHRVPWLSGVVSSEGLIYAAVIMRNDTMIKLVNEKFEDLAADLLFYKKVPGVGKIIKDYYFPPTTITTTTTDDDNDGSSSDKKNVQRKSQNINSMTEFANYTQLFSDRGFYVGLHRAATIQSKYSDVYLYYNNYGGEFSLTHYLLAFKMQYPIVVELLYHVVSSWINRNIFGRDAPFYGVCHADDVALLFKMPWMSNIKPNDRDYQMSKQMVKIWTTFATNEKSLSFQNVPWPANGPNRGATEGPLKFMKIEDQKAEIIGEPFSERVQFWLKLNLENYDS